MIDLDMILSQEITVSKTNGITIGVYGSGQTLRNFAQDPYFKVYNAESEQKATKVARIYFNRPEYVYPEHKESGKKVWYFNSLERKLLNNILSDPDIWGQLVIALNKVTYLLEWYSKPDYTKLERGK